MIFSYRFLQSVLRRADVVKFSVFFEILSKEKIREYNTNVINI